MRRNALGMVGAGALLTGGLFLAAANPASATPPHATTCSGAVAPGTYSRLLVPPGARCDIPGAVTILSGVAEGEGAAITVDPAGDLKVLGGLVLEADAVFADLQNSSPVHVFGPVTVHSGAAFALGTETPDGPVVNAISGPVRGDDASTVQVHNTSVFGPVVLRGGGSVNPIVGPGVNFNDLEDNTIHGPVVENGYGGIWTGVIRNKIYGGLTFVNNAEVVPDEYDIGSNLIVGPARCDDNNPAPNMGASRGSPSIVIGPTLGDQAATCTGVPSGITGPPV